jgi:hypothetical protein
MPACLSERVLQASVFPQDVDSALVALQLLVELEDHIGHPDIWTKILFAKYHAPLAVYHVASVNYYRS